MPLLSTPAFGPRAAMTYITSGALLDVWTTVWYFAFVRPGPEPVTNMVWFWLVGLFLTGITLVVLGILLGPIGQAARRAELPPPEVIQPEATIQRTAAANPSAVTAAPNIPISGNGVRNPGHLPGVPTALPAQLPVAHR